MKYSIECKIGGNLHANNRIAIINGNYTYSFSPDKEGVIRSIKITKQVEKSGKFGTSIEPGKGQSKATFVINTDATETEAIISEFREIESLLSFYTQGRLKYIDVSTMKTEFVADNDEEATRLNVSGVTLTNKYPELPIFLEEDELDDVLKRKQYFGELLVPMAFYREGINEYEAKRYINAYINFYYLIEDFYCHGKTGSNTVFKQLKQSKELMDILPIIKKKFIDEQQRHKNKFMEYLGNEQLAYDVDGLLKLIICVRGNVHHYYSKSSKKQATPFSHQEFESIAFFIMGLATTALTKRWVKLNNTINSEHNSK